MFWQVMLGLIPPSSLIFCSRYVFSKRNHSWVLFPFSFFLFFFTVSLFLFLFFCYLTLQRAHGMLATSRDSGCCSHREFAWILYRWNTSEHRAVPVAKYILSSRPGFQRTDRHLGIEIRVNITKYLFGHWYLIPHLEHQCGSWSVRHHTLIAHLIPGTLQFVDVWSPRMIRSCWFASNICFLFIDDVNKVPPLTMRWRTMARVLSGIKHSETESIENNKSRTQRHLTWTMSWQKAHSITDKVQTIG